MLNNQLVIMKAAMGEKRKSCPKKEELLQKSGQKNERQ
jgi:hypothetical protein